MTFDQRRWRETGSAAAGQMGGHKPRAIAGEHRAWLIERCRAQAFTNSSRINTSGRLANQQPDHCPPQGAHSNDGSKIIPL